MVSLAVLEWLIAITYAMPWTLLARFTAELSLLVVMIPAWFVIVMLCVKWMDSFLFRRLALTLGAVVALYAATVAVAARSPSILIAIGPIVGWILIYRFWSLQEVHDKAAYMVRRFPFESAVYALMMGVLLLEQDPHSIVSPAITVVAAVGYLFVRCASLVVTQRRLYMTAGAAILFAGVVMVLIVVFSFWRSIVNAAGLLLFPMGYAIGTFLFGIASFGVYVDNITWVQTLGIFLFLIAALAMVFYFSFMRGRLKMGEGGRKLPAWVRALGPLMMGLGMLLMREHNLPRGNSVTPLGGGRTSPGSLASSNAGGADPLLWILVSCALLALLLLLLRGMLRRRNPYSARVYRTELQSANKSYPWTETSSPVRRTYQLFLKRLVDGGMDLHSADTSRDVEEQAARMEAGKRSLISRLTRLYETVRYGGSETPEMDAMSSNLLKELGEHRDRP